VGEAHPDTWVESMGRSSLTLDAKLGKMAGMGGNIKQQNKVIFKMGGFELPF
jgi:hypothetical protein